MAAGDRLIGNSAFLLLDWIAITVLSLVFWFIIGKTLPKEVYGVVATAVNVIIILSGIALLGLNTTVIKMISEFGGGRQIEKIRSLIRFSVKIGMAVSFVFAASMALLSGFLSPLLNLPVNVILTIAAGILIFSAWGLTTSVLYGFQSMKRVMKTNFLGNVVKVIVTFSLVVLGFSYFGPLIGLLLSVLAIILLRIDTLLLARKIAGSIRSAKLNYKSIITYSVSALIASIAMVGFANTPNIILNALTGPAITGIFAISLTITSPIFSIPSVLNSALFPITSSLSAQKGGRTRQRMLINMVVKYAAFITLPLIALLLVFSGSIILFFSSTDYLAAVDLLPVMGFAAFLFGIGGIINMSIYAVRKPKVSRNITILALLMFLVLSAPLTMWLSAMGMAIAYLVSVFVFCVASIAYLRKFIGFALDWRSFMKIVAAVVVFFGLLFGIDLFTSNEIVKFVGAVTSLVLYLFMLVPMRFYKKEDIKVLDFLSQKSPVGKGLFAAVRGFLSRYV